MKLHGGKEWFTAAELAELALAGLPTTKRKINERAAEERWAIAVDAKGMPLARPRQARGGGLEYHLTLLPPATRSALAAMGVAVVANVSDEPPVQASQLWRWYEGAGERVQSEAHRRLAVVQLVDTLVAAGMTRSAAVPAAAKDQGVGISTLWSWLGLVDGVALADRLAHLAPRRQGGGVEATVPLDAWQFLISDFMRLEQPTFSACYGRMTRAFPGHIFPTERTLRRKFDREIDQRLVTLKRQGSEALRQTLPSQERSVMELHALEAVNIDGHKFDVFCRWPDGRIGRPMMVTIQDIYSRKILAWRVDESESALSTRLVFADLFTTWGIPKACLMDNGRAFASKTITGGAKTRFRFKIKDEEPTGVLTALGIAIHWATPYRGQSKPIERAFRDLCDTIAKHPALAGAYTGNKPDAKPENYGSRAIPIEEFRALVDAGIAAHNAKPNRRTETAQGRHSFDDVFMASYAVAPIGKATPEQQRLALLTAEDRFTDRKTGELTLEGNRYWAPELADHSAKRVTVRFDPDNLHGEVHVYERSGAFICTAPAIEKTGFFDKASAGKRRAQEADLRRQVRDVEKATGLIEAAKLAAMMPEHPDEADAPSPSVVRPVRHRGQTAAALKPVSEAVQAPLNPVLDRLSHLRLVG
ncbi:transposase domain-containing protein [Sphingomonas sp. Marseille-Q8236]